MKNFIKLGSNMTYVADGNYKAGEIVQIGTLLGVNAFDVLTGQEGEIQFGVFTAPKATGVALDKGMPVLWDATSKTFSGGGTGSAFAYEAASSSDTTVLIGFTGGSGGVGAKYGPDGSLQALLDGDGGVAFNLTVIPVEASRELTQSDNGATLDCDPDVVLTVPPGLINFGCAVRPIGTQIAFASGVTGNGAATTLTTTTRVAAINPTATDDDYDIVGAE